MPRGGKRQGAGRPKGSREDLSAAKALAPAAPVSAGLIAELDSLASGHKALEFLQTIYRSKAAPLDARFAAAAKAAPLEKAAGKDAGTGGLMIKLGRHGAASD